MHEIRGWLKPKIWEKLPPDAGYWIECSAFSDKGKTFGAVCTLHMLKICLQLDISKCRPVFATALVKSVKAKHTRI